MVKGASSKKIITKKILETFPGAFLYNGGKELRVPLTEDGETVQIKIALTCAKVNVEPETSTTPQPITTTSIPAASSLIDAKSNQITPEEKQEVVDLIERLNL